MFKKHRFFLVIVVIAEEGEREREDEQMRNLLLLLHLLNEANLYAYQNFIVAVVAAAASANYSGPRSASPDGAVRAPWGARTHY